MLNPPLGKPAVHLTAQFRNPALALIILLRSSIEDYLYLELAGATQ